MLRTVSNPELHKIDDHFEQAVGHRLKFHRSLDDLDTVRITRKSESSDGTSKTTRVIRDLLRMTTEDRDDDDDVWCNPEDEANWKHLVEIDEQKEKQLREILGDDLINLIRQTIEVKLNSILSDMLIFSFPFRKMKPTSTI